MEYLTSPPAQEEIVANSELAANPDVAAAGAHPRLGRRQARPDRRRARRRAAARRDRADAEGRVEVAAAAARRAAPARGARRAGRSPPRSSRSSSRGRWPRCRCRSSSSRSAFGEIADSLLGEALRASLVLALGRGRGDAGCSAARWPRSCPSTTSRAGAGSTGRSCCRWRCRPTCSCSCCSASTTRRARCRARCARVLGDGFQLPAGALDGRHDPRADARALPVRLHPRARRVPRAVARHDGGRAHARPEPRGARSRASRCRWRGRRWPRARRSR